MVDICIWDKAVVLEGATKALVVLEIVPGNIGVSVPIQFVIQRYWVGL